jgi:hypothetical protein
VILSQQRKIGEASKVKPDNGKRASLVSKSFAFLQKVMFLSTLNLYGWSVAGAADTRSAGELAWKSPSAGFYLPIEYNQPAAAPLVTAGGNIPVIAYDSSGQGQDQLALFDDQGSILWQTSSIVLNKFTSPAEKFYPPVVTQDGTSFLITDNNRIFVIAADGSYVRDSFWPSYRGSIIDDSSDRLITYFSDIFSTNDDIIFSHTFNSQQQYEMTENWRFPLSDFANGLSGFAKPQISTREGVTYVLLAPLFQVEGAATGTFNTPACVIALDASGSKSWQWCNDTNFPPNSKIVFGANGSLNFSTSNSVISLTQEGVESWRTEIPGGAMQPAVAPDGSLFINTDAGAVGGKKLLFSLNADGSQRWRSEIENEIGLGNDKTTPLIASDGTIYFTNNIRVYDPVSNNYVNSANLAAISASGQLLWIYDTNEEGDPSSPSFNNDQSLIFFSAKGHSFHAVHIGNAENQLPTVSNDLVITIPKLIHEGSYYSAKFDFNGTCWSVRDIASASPTSSVQSSIATIPDNLTISIPKLVYQGSNYLVTMGYNGSCWIMASASSL